VRTILTVKRYSDEGQGHERASLADLAVHQPPRGILPDTHRAPFIADQPPPPVVKSMAQAYRQPWQLNREYQGLDPLAASFRGTDGAKVPYAKGLSSSPASARGVAVWYNPALWKAC